MRARARPTRLTRTPALKRVRWQPSGPSSLPSNQLHTRPQAAMAPPRTSKSCKHSGGNAASRPLAPSRHPHRPSLLRRARRRACPGGLSRPLQLRCGHSRRVNQSRLHLLRLLLLPRLRRSRRPSHPSSCGSTTRFRCSSTRPSSQRSSHTSPAEQRHRLAIILFGHFCFVVTHLSPLAC